MTIEIIIVLAVLAGAILLFMSNRIRMDLVGLLVLGSLAVSGVITPEEALSGFSNPAVCVKIILQHGIVFFHMGKS